MVNAVLNADFITSNLTLGSANAIIWIRSAYDNSNAAYNNANVGLTSANNYAGAMANSGNVWTQTIVDANLVTARAYTNTSVGAANTWANTKLANTSGVFNGNLTHTGFVTANNGLYTSNNFTGTFVDGVVIDYVSSNGRISVGTGDGLKFYNGGLGVTPILTLTSSGYVGIGTENPGYKVDVVGTINCSAILVNGAPISGGGGGSGISNTVNSSTIGSIQVTNNLFVSNNIYTSNSVFATHFDNVSDRSLKENIEIIYNSDAIVSNLN
jgi:hypothetical protein